jgi:hypothetical protein
MIVKPVFSDLPSEDWNRVTYKTGGHYIQVPLPLYEMHSKEKLNLRSHTTSHCLIEVVTKAGLTVFNFEISIVLTV